MIWKIIKDFLLGLLCGIFLTILLYVLFFIIELGNFFWTLFTCDSTSGDLMPIVWSWAAFFNIAFLSIAGCSTIGIICGTVVVLEEKREEADERKRKEELTAKKHREKNAEELKIEVGKYFDNINTIKKEIYSYKLSFLYESDKYSEKFYDFLEKAYADNAILRNFVEESNYE